MTKLLALPDVLKHRRQFGLFDDFDHFDSGSRWTPLVSSGGTTDIAADGVGGELQLTTAGSLNAYAAIQTSVALFQFRDDKPLMLEARVHFDNAATTEVLVGIMSTSGTDALQDNGLGPPASYSGAALFSVAGSNTWECGSSIGSVGQRQGTSIIAGGTGDQILRIEFQPMTAEEGEIRFFVDDLFCDKHVVAFSPADVMRCVAVVKAGSAAIRTLSLDYISCHQLR